MTTPIFAIVPASFENASATLIAASGVAAKVLVDQFAAAAATGTAPQFNGGCSVIDITATSTDSAAKDLLLYHGIVTTTVGGATGAVTTTTNTIARASGSFIADGWVPGSLVMMFAPRGVAANTFDGLLAIVTGVSAGALTVNGAPFGAGSVASGSRICNMSLDLRAIIPGNSGTSGASTSIALLDHDNDGSLLRSERKLGANDLLAVAATSALSALPAYMNVSAQVARY